jgi:hypothetical protein
MTREGTKQAAEAVLRELPSVIGAFVREDVNGHPREVHLLVRAGPNPRHLAYDVRDLLEERLGVPIDQRVISIAQLAEGRTPGPALAADAGIEDPAAGIGDPASLGARPQTASGTEDRSEHVPATPAWPDTAALAGAAGAGAEAAGASAGAPAASATAAGAPAAAGPTPPPAAGEPRVLFAGITLEAMDNRVRARVVLHLDDEERAGESIGLDTEPARLRTAAAATLVAVDTTCIGRARFEVEHVNVVTAFGREYVLVSVLASSPYLGRRPISLVGAHLVEMDAESAAALAALKAVNRTLSLVLRLPHSHPPRARPGHRRS